MFCKMFCKKNEQCEKKYFIKLTRVKNDSLRDFIYFQNYKHFYCIISNLLLTNFIPTNLCLTTIQYKI